MCLKLVSETRNMSLYKAVSSLFLKDAFFGEIKLRSTTLTFDTVYKDLTKLYVIILATCSNGTQEKGWGQAKKIAWRGEEVILPTKGRG